TVVREKRREDEQTREAEQARRGRRERDENIGPWGERLIAPEDQLAMQKEIDRLMQLHQDHKLTGDNLSGETLDRIFNRMFDQLDNAISQEFRDAFGSLASYERNH